LPKVARDWTKLTKNQAKNFPKNQKPKKKVVMLCYMIGGWVGGSGVQGMHPRGGSVGFFLFVAAPASCGGLCAPLSAPLVLVLKSEVAVPFLLSPACSSTRSMRAHRIRRLPAVPHTLCPPPLPPLLPSCGTTHSVPPPPPPFYLLAVPRTREHASQSRLRVCEFRVHVR
jgi:hypothetical protein